MKNGDDGDVQHFVDDDDDDDDAVAKPLSLFRVAVDFVLVAV